MEKTKRNKKRRSDFKKLTKEAEVLKYMRESKKLSMRRAGKALGLSDSTISHAENGRLDLKPELIQKLVVGYGYSYSDFLEYSSGKKEVPENILNECIGILRRLKPEKLRTVKAVLESF